MVSDRQVSRVFKLIQTEKRKGLVAGKKGKDKNTVRNYMGWENCRVRS